MKLETIQPIPERPARGTVGYPPEDWEFTLWAEMRRREREQAEEKTNG